MAIDALDGKRDSAGDAAEGRDCFQGHREGLGELKGDE